MLYNSWYRVFCWSNNQNFILHGLTIVWCNQILGAYIKCKYPLKAFLCILHTQAPFSTCLKFRSKHWGHAQRFADELPQSIKLGSDLKSRCTVYECISIWNNTIQYLQSVIRTEVYHVTQHSPDETTNDIANSKQCPHLLKLPVLSSSTT